MDETYLPEGAIAMENYTEYSGFSSLALLGVWTCKKGIWGDMNQITILQKVIKYTPNDKLKDCFMNIMAGGHGIVEINNLIRTDKGLQLCFGRSGCGEQSTISETLNACTEKNIDECRGALKQIYKKNSYGYRHNYKAKCQVLDIDTSAMLAGKQAEGATKGYFSGHKNRRGRQLGRVIAYWYDEIVSEKLYSGTIQLEKNLIELVKMAENVLDMNEKRRRHTIIRTDAGGGTDADINFSLGQNYYLMSKMKNWQRTCKMVKTVTTWLPVPQLPDHECGWVGEPHQYVRPTRQLAMRWPKKEKGGWNYCVLVFNLPNKLIFELAGVPKPKKPKPVDLITTIINAYDLRGGGIETSLKNSKQGLGLNKRNKKLFHAQEMLVLIAQLAYNVVTWFQKELAANSKIIASFRTMRMIRDVFRISGMLVFDAQNNLVMITLNQSHKLAKPFCETWKEYFARSKLSLNLGKI